MVNTTQGSPSPQEDKQRILEKIAQKYDVTLQKEDTSIKQLIRTLQERASDTDYTETVDYSQILREYRQIERLESKSQDQIDRILGIQPTTASPVNATCQHFIEKLKEKTFAQTFLNEEGQSYRFTDLNKEQQHSVLENVVNHTCQNDQEFQKHMENDATFRKDFFELAQKEGFANTSFIIALELYYHNREPLTVTSTHEPSTTPHNTTTRSEKASSFQELERVTKKLKEVHPEKKNTLDTILENKQFQEFFYKLDADVKQADHQKMQDTKERILENLLYVITNYKSAKIYTDSRTPRNTR